ncbi:MAG: hypothetical protein O3C46_06130 [Bacteroidetes bacterium]|nr:hypothetical protein [Bacteroidota bacterium]
MDADFYHKEPYTGSGLDADFYRKEPYTGSGLDANFYRKSRKGRRKGRKGGVVNTTTFSFNPNLSELCADMCSLW